MSKTKKTVRFYSKAETAEVQTLANSGKPVTPELLKDFCAKNNRNYGAVSVKIYNIRRKNSKSSGLLKDKSVKLLPKNHKQEDVTMKKGEFNIPIKNWKIVQNTAGEMIFVAKF